MKIMIRPLLTAVLLTSFYDSIVEGAAFVSGRTALIRSNTVVTPSAREDFYHEPHFEVMATSSSVVMEPVTETEKMLACAQRGECTIQELDRMLADLAHHEEKHALKQALLLQRQLASLQEELEDSVKPDAPTYSFSSASQKTDHSFEHYVDYKDMSDYESH